MSRCVQFHRGLSEQCGLLVYLRKNFRARARENRFPASSQRLNSSEDYKIDKSILDPAKRYAALLRRRPRQKEQNK